MAENHFITPSGKPRKQNDIIFRRWLPDIYWNRPKDRDGDKAYERFIQKRNERLGR